jgi:solute carrier family 50 protein (sugar transporter)
MVTITDFFGWVGVLVSIIFFASPLPQFINLIKKKSKFTEINIIIIIGNYISSIVWLIYGYRIKIKQITVCYSIGALISLIWIWAYLIYMGKKKISQSLIFTILLSALTFALYIVLTVIISDIKTLGEVCFIVCSLSYISPTQLLIKVLNTKDYKLIPIYSAVIATIGYGSWTLFGLFKFNANIIIPNLVGLGFSLAQIILYRVYKNKKPLAEELGNISHSVIGAVKNVVEKTVEIANSINPTGPENKGSAPTNLGLNTTNPQDSTKVSDATFDTNNTKNTSNIDTSMNFNTNLDPNETANDKTGNDTNNNNNDLPIV